MHDVARPVETEPRIRTRRGKTVAWTIAGIVAIVIVLFGIKAMQIGKMMSTPFVMPPTAVSSVQVKEESWPPILSAIGSVSAVQGAVVSTELGGTVSQVLFQNGGVAKQG